MSDNSSPNLPTERAPAALAAALDAAKTYARHSRADNTWRAYRSDWRRFEEFGRAVDRVTLPATPETVALFLAREADQGRKPNTIARRLSAIRWVHRAAGLPSPHDAVEVNEVLRGIRRARRHRPAKKTPAVDEAVQRMVDAVPLATAAGFRDRALLLMGFAGAFRRSELVALDIEDLETRDAGLLVTIRESKTDPDGEGQRIAILAQPGSPYCPVRALQDWLRVAEISEGAVFRRLYRGDTVGASRLSAQSVALVIKRYAIAADLVDPQKDPDGRALEFAGHSLRSGYLTSAARQRASLFKMADQSRHKSLDMLREYVRDEELFDDHSGAELLRGGRASETK